MAGTGLMEIAGGLAAAAKILKTLKSLVTAPDAKAQVIELYDVIISTQAGALEGITREHSMLEEIRDLKEQLGRAEAWGTQKIRYKLATPHSGVTVYALQKSMSDGEPPHYICANCYQSGKRAMLQQTRTKDGFVAIACSSCRFQADTRHRGLGPAQYAEEISNPA